jgi:hypothetical protein
MCIRTDESYTSHINFLMSGVSTLSRSLERKIEQTFLREDFRRIRGNEIGESLRSPDLPPAT